MKAWRRLQKWLGSFDAVLSTSSLAFHLLMKTQKKYKNVKEGRHTDLSKANGVQMGNIYQREKAGKPDPLETRRSKGASAWGVDQADGCPPSRSRHGGGCLEVPCSAPWCIFCELLAVAFSLGNDNSEIGVADGGFQSSGAIGIPQMESQASSRHHLLGLPQDLVGFTFLTSPC